MTWAESGSLRQKGRCCSLGVKLEFWQLEELVSARWSNGTCCRLLSNKPLRCDSHLRCGCSRMTKPQAGTVFEGAPLV